VPLRTPSLCPSGQPLPKRFSQPHSQSVDLRAKLANLVRASHREVLLPAARPTLLLLKELLCIRRGVSCSHRADNRSEGDEDRYKLRHGLRHRLRLRLRHRLRHRLRLWHPHGCALSIPETVSSSVITNGATNANRWVSHARVKRSDQSCRRRHSHDRFVQGCCLLRDRSHRRCTESDHRGMKSRSRLATSTSIVRSLSRCFVDFESDGLSRVAECCAHQAARHDVATTDQRRQWRCRDRDEHRRAPKIMRSAPAARARGGTAPTA